jgi:hypothetical protein
MSSNRLPILAAEIRKAHADVQEAAKTAAEHAIAAGHALIEAKGLLKHGEWLPWLREHCALAERTAQLYMKIAHSGLESAIVADLGLQGAAKVLGTLPYPFPDPFGDGDADQRLEWVIFVLFLRSILSYRVGSAIDNCWWIRRKDFATPSEWLSPEGRKWARRVGLRIGDGVEPAWLEFLVQHRERTLEDINAEICRLEEAEPPEKTRTRRRKRRAAA